MRLVRFIFALILIGLSNGCADFLERQSPAPILGRYPEPYPREPEPVAQPPLESSQQTPPPVVVTRPLENGGGRPNMTEVQPGFQPPVIAEPPPATEPAPSGDLGQPAETPPTENPDTGAQGGAGSTEPASSETKPSDQLPPPIAEPGLPEPAKPVESFTPMESIGPQSPAVGALVMSANENSQGGNYDSAVASIERAIRIEPRNAALYYKLAVLRLNQSKPRLAEDIARKAALLAGSDNSLKKHCWLLIANARESQGNYPGAEKAKTEAAKY
jgi:Tetratricopeptide repeat